MNSVVRRRVVAGSGAVCVALAVTLPMCGVGAAAVSSGDPGSGFESLGLAAVSDGVRYLPNPTFTGGEAVEGDVPYAESTISVGPIGHALASIAWPGEVPANGGSALQLIGNPLPVGPDQPPPVVTNLEGQLNDPVLAQAQTGSGKSTNSYHGVPGATMTATATRSLIHAVSTVSQASSAAFSVSGGTAESTLRLTGPTTAVGEATSEVRGITVASVLRIGAVRSVAHATTNGEKATATGTTTVSDVSVAGIPVTIDNSGVHVAGHGLAVLAATKSVTAALDKAGLHVLLVQPQQHPSRGSITYDAGSLIIDSPNFGDVVLGGAHLALAATRATPFHLPATKPVGAGQRPSSTGSTSAGTTTGSTSGGSLPAGSSQLPAGRTTGGAAPAVASPVMGSKPAGFNVALGAGWFVLALIGSSLIAVGLRRLPDRIVATDPLACPRGGDR